MSEGIRARRPDRQIYRHPKYENDESATAVRSPQKSVGTVGECKHSSLCESQTEAQNTRQKRKLISHHGRGDAGGRYHRGSGFTRNAPENLAMQSASTRQPLAGGKKSSDNFDRKVVVVSQKGSTAKGPEVGYPGGKNFGDKLRTASVTSHDIPVSSNDQCLRHGGLIHLPKDVDIHVSNQEVQATSSRQFKRTCTEGGSTKPVLVVRPSFSQAGGSSKSQSPSAASSLCSNSRAAQDALKSATTAEARVANSRSSDQNPQSPLVPVVAWTDAAKAAFDMFFQPSHNLRSERDNQKPLEGSSLPQTITSNTFSPGVHFPAVPVQAPNETISRTMEQIVQLDATISALLIPPSLYAKVTSPLQLPPLSEESSKLTETERMVLRWWSTIQRLRDGLYTLFESVILSDLDFCNTAHVEQGMWRSVFYTVLELLRSWISNPEATGLLSNVVNKRDDSDMESRRKQLVAMLQRICLSDVIDVGESRLCNLLDRLQAVHHVQLAPLLAEYRPPPETRSRTRRLVYLSAQKLMLFLGDLARYREILVGECNFGKARSWYQKAQLLVPKNGRSYNQLAVLAVYTSRHLDAVCYYMRTLATSNPFPTASQSLTALFSEVRLRAENLIRRMQKNPIESNGHQQASISSSEQRFQRVEIWVHPIDGRTTVLQGTRRLVYPPSRLQTRVCQQYGKSVVEEDPAENDEEYDEEAQAEQEEYANISLIELSKQFGLTFLHAHGKLFTKIGMETFPEVASLALQAFSGLLAQTPCPLSAERLCQLCIINMFNVDRAASLTTSASFYQNAKPPLSDESESGVPSSSYPGSSAVSRLDGVETLRSVHHDHAARFALDTFSLLCRRAARLLSEPPPTGAPPYWLSPDARLLLPPLRLWSEWMILHPEHWVPPPNHRDPTLRPCLNDWELVAELCTQASTWLNRNQVRPKYDEVTPTTSMVLRLTGYSAEEEHEDDEGKQTVIPSDADLQSALLFEETSVAGFKPMLDMTPKMYRYGGNWDRETVADFIRIEKLILFGDFLCGIDSPVLIYNVDRGAYESAVERESSERKEDQQQQSGKQRTSDLSAESPNNPDEKVDMDSSASDQRDTVSPDTEASADIAALQRQRALLRRQLEEESRLVAWRRNAIRQAASGGRRAVELVVRPIYLLPDTNCYIDWLEGIATLAQRSSNYTVLVPIVVVNELDTLARYGSSSSSCGGPRSCELTSDTGSEVTRTGLIQERAHSAIAFLEREFAHRNTRLRALTARGSFLETIAYRTEVNGGREPGQTNDDVILTCCSHFCKDEPDRFYTDTHGDLARDQDQSFGLDQNNQPKRIVREVVLLTSDRNLRVKALNLNVPARPLRTFVWWSRLPVVAQLCNLNSAAEPGLAVTQDDRNSEFPKPQPRGQWKQPLRY